MGTSIKYSSSYTETTASYIRSIQHRCSTPPSRRFDHFVETASIRAPPKVRDLEKKSQLNRQINKRQLIISCLVMTDIYLLRQELPIMLHYIILSSADFTVVFCDLAN